MLDRTRQSSISGSSAGFPIADDNYIYHLAHLTAAAAESLLSPLGLPGSAIVAFVATAIPLPPVWLDRYRTRAVAVSFCGFRRGGVEGLALPPALAAAW